MVEEFSASRASLPTSYVPHRQIWQLRAAFWTGKDKRVRRFFWALITGLIIGTLHGYADARVVQKFDGTDASLATATFTVQDKWEILWLSPRPMSVTLLSPDGTVISGAASAFRGALYQPKGGTFYLQSNSSHPEMKAASHIIIAEVARRHPTESAGCRPDVLLHEMEPATSRLQQFCPRNAWPGHFR